MDDGAALERPMPWHDLSLKEWGGRLEHVLGELPLVGEQLLGEVIGAGHNFIRPGQLVSEREIPQAGSPA